jgi:hypothetical protein
LTREDLTDKCLDTHFCDAEEIGKMLYKTGDLA